MVGDAGRVHVEFCFGPHRQKTPSLTYEQGSYLCDQVVGRLEPARIYVPRQLLY